MDRIRIKMKGWTVEKWILFNIVTYKGYTIFMNKDWTEEQIDAEMKKQIPLRFPEYLKLIPKKVNNELRLYEANYKN